MSKRNLMAACLLAALFSPAALAHGVLDGTQNPNHVPGEDLDSGLGELDWDYTAAEFNRHRHNDAVLDRTRVPGEKVDSGPGALTREEIERVVAASGAVRPELTSR